MARWAEWFHDELNGHVFDLERMGSARLYLAHGMTANSQIIKDRSPPGSTRTAPPYTRTVLSMLLVYCPGLGKEITSTLAH